MVDQITERETPPQYFVAPESSLQGTATEMARDLKDDLGKKGELTLDELLNSVYEWENVHGEKLGDDEFEALSILSLALGTTKVILSEHVGSKGKSERAMMQSIATQQDVVRTVLGSLDENGMPDRGLAKTFCLVTEIFEDYFNPESPKLTDPGAETVAGFWQGVQGMVTTSLLLREAGWEVKLPPPELDMKYEMDLLARNQKGEVYAIDVTARVPKMIDDLGTMSKPYTVEKSGVPRYVPKDAVKDLKGFIKINVPPLRHYASRTFYEDRLIGSPSKEAVDEFVSRVEK